MDRADPCGKISHHVTFDYIACKTSERAVTRPQSAASSEQNFTLPASGLLARNNFRLARNSGAAPFSKENPFVNFRVVAVHQLWQVSVSLTARRPILI